MKPAGARGHPDLLSGLMAVDDQGRSTVELDLQNIALAVDVEVDISLVGQGTQRGLDDIERRLCRGKEGVSAHAMLAR